MHGGEQGGASEERKKEKGEERQGACACALKGKEKRELVGCSTVEETRDTHAKSSASSGASSSEHGSYGELRGRERRVASGRA